MKINLLPPPPFAAVAGGGFVVLFGDRVYCSPDFLRTLSIDQTGLELRDLSASGDIFQSVEYLLAHAKSWVSCRAPYEPDMVVHAQDPRVLWR